MDCLGTDGAGLMDFNASVYATFAVTGNVAVGVKLAWMSLLDRDVRDVDLYNDKDILWGGITLNAAL